MARIVAAHIVAGLACMCGCKSNEAEMLAAIRNRDVDAVRALLAEGVELEPYSGLHDVNKPLAYASGYGNLEIIELLVEAGADLNGRVAYGDVPLIKADEHNNDDITAYLIKNGADVNAPNYFGMTPFIGLSGRGKLELVTLAIQHGADINSRFVAESGEGTGKENHSALLSAAAHGKTEVVKLLLAHGADATAKDSDGVTPLEHAEAEGHEEIAQLLREHLAAMDEE